MSLRTLLLSALFVAAALAGCSSPPPSGELEDLGLVLVADGSLTVHFVAERKPYEEQAGQDLPENLECAPDDAPMELDQYKCVDPETTVSGHFMSLPIPDASGYMVYALDPSPDLALGAPVAGEGTMFDLPEFNIGEDLSLDNVYTRMEVRMGNFVYATAAFAEGSQMFTVAPGLDAITASGTYKGKTLTVDISGLPGNDTTYMGHLYQVGADGATLESVEHYPVANGENVITASKTLDKYVQFHIHVGDSKINLFQTSIV